MTHQSVTELIKAQQANLVNKLAVRTQLMIEAMPPVEEDTRPQWFKDWDAANYDNPKSPLYRDEDAGYLAAAIEKQSVDEIDRPFRSTIVNSLPVRRGTVVVLIDSKLYTWNKDRDGVSAGTVLVCTGENLAGENGKRLTNVAKYGTQRFRTFTDSTTYALALTDANARYANEKEIDAFVAAGLKASPMEFIKKLGDSVELDALD